MHDRIDGYRGYLRTEAPPDQQQIDRAQHGPCTIPIGARPCVLHGLHSWCVNFPIGTRCDEGKWLHHTLRVNYIHVRRLGCALAGIAPELPEHPLLEVERGGAQA